MYNNLLKTIKVVIRKNFLYCDDGTFHTRISLPSSKISPIPIIQTLAPSKIKHFNPPQQIF